MFADEVPLSFTLTARMLPLVADRDKPKADSLATQHPARLHVVKTKSADNRAIAGA